MRELFVVLGGVVGFVLVAISLTAAYIHYFYPHMALAN